MGAFYRGYEQELMSGEVEPWKKIAKDHQNMGMLSDDEFTTLCDSIEQKIDSWIELYRSSTSFQTISEHDFVEHAAILHWYSLEKPNTYSKVSTRLNDPKTRRKARKIAHCIPWARKVVHAMQTMPPCLFRICDLFRGVSTKLSEGAWNKYKPNSTICWYTTKSATLYKELAENDFARENGTRGTLFVVTNYKALFIPDFTHFDEGEGLIMPGTKFRVVDQSRGGPDALDVITLDAILPDMK